MSKKVKGVLKSCGDVPGSSKLGYRDLWDTGRASVSKRKQKVTGPNRPSI